MLFPAKVNLADDDLSERNATHQLACRLSPPDSGVKGVFQAQSCLAYEEGCFRRLHCSARFREITRAPASLISLSGNLAAVSVPSH